MRFSKKDAIQRLFLRPWIGPYIARSHGWRCDECPGIGRHVVRSQGRRYDEYPWMDGIPQGARMAVRICTGSTVYRKEPWMAVRICLVYFLVCFSISFVYIPQALADSGCSSEHFDETS
ncbi:MAG: hypothetical protein GQ573_05675, partial [Gammaproteobacteria bacterium]|nr:hypothetical protein [Gammaproteobacteria bacterium]